MTSDSTISVLRDVLRVYDQRYLSLDGLQRERLVDGTRRVIGEEGLSDAARAAMPASVRLRAFCIQHGLREELERLIRDEVEGSPAGAVVVGGRIYAMYPYLRGVPRQDADITTEVGVEHRLDAVAWQGRKVRIRGAAALQRVETNRTAVDVILRERTSGKEHGFPADPREDGFEAVADPAAFEPGRWDVHVTATTLGVTREARFGSVRAEGAKTAPQRRTADTNDVTVYFTKGGHLALSITEATAKPSRRPWYRRRYSR
ncbi:hypothetical protein E1293_46815 [Actinomadura darangshiensis]|uniref:Uncharacterized protein n=1 Tax=Actinomadura darangshiensis TaxID=705336 RepID=A0A4R4ZJI0_9ACTN|nr:hypothetical protein [Actinomadura darangshiensis]TDD58793.1 hypothetical protein E1293_46815 [Actinomadura darangshiensis]